MKREINCIGIKELPILNVKRDELAAMVSAYEQNTTLLEGNIFSDVRINNLVISGCYKNFEFLDEHIDKEAYSMFLMDVGLDNLRGCEVVTFSLANYNDYLKDFFGPDVKQLTIDNFETGKTALEKGLAVDGD